ncbi:MAG: shikimate dehydrogenase [Candidatus Omnitrophota bacterium]|nr:shikimate dehydrogenase [Candidatus Omnitrophota bacterium]
MTLKPKLYGLVGFPIKHSLSPCMHNAAFSALKIKAKYKLFELQAEQLEDFLNNLEKNNIGGFNVTIPYKEKVLPYLDFKSRGVGGIGAVNTVVIKDKKLRGFNTDFLGFSRHLKKLKVTPKKTAIIGAGGAAKAVCFALGQSKVEEICIYDIDAYKSLNLASQFKDVFNLTKFSAVARIDELNLRGKDLLVNASPVGMRPDDPCLIASEAIHRDLFVYDLIYNPAETKLIARARLAGAGFSNGLGMLLYQGILSFKHFTGKNAPAEIMRAALEKGVKKL